MNGAPDKESLISARRYVPFLLLLILAGSAALPLPVPVRVVAAMIVVMGGFPLALFAAGRPDSGDAAAIGSAISRGILLGMAPAVLLTGLGLLGMPLSKLLWLHLFSLAALLSVVPLRGGRRTAEVVADRSDSRALLWLIPVLVLAVSISAVRGTPLGTTDDSFDHLASLRHMMESGHVEFPGAFYGLNDVHGSDPRKGILLLVMALAGRLSGADATAVWRWSGVVMTPLVLLAVASLSLVLFRRAWAGIAGATAMMMTWGDPLWVFRGAYGGHWGLAIAWAGTACVLGGCGIWTCALAGAVCASVHAYSPVQLLAPLALASVFRVFRSELPLRKLLGMLMGALPVEFLRFLAGRNAANPLHDQAMGWLVLPFGPIASPLQLLTWYGYTGVAAGLILLILAPRIRDRAGVFILSTLLSPMLLLLNPVLFGPVAAKLGSVANKLALVWVYPLAVLWMMDRAFSRERPGRISARIGGGVVCALTVLALPGRAEMWFTRPADLPADFKATMALVADHTPPRSIVASDPMTSYAIPALTGRRGIVTLHQHSPPGDSRALERLSVTGALYSTCVPLSEALKRVRNEGAEYLLFAALPATRLDQFGNHPDPRNREILAARFRSRPDLLEVTGSNGGSTLYRILPGAMESSSRESGIDSDAPFPESIKVSDGTMDLAAGPGLPETCRRGERLILPVAWRKHRDPAPYFEYFGHLRFENVDQRPLSPPLDLIAKPLRRLILEPRAGGSLRWRTVEMPFRGLCGPVEWQSGVWFPDSMEVIVPQQLVPGRYRVRMSLERGTLYPSLSPADLLTDEDRFSGPIIGSLLIQ